MQNLAALRTDLHLSWQGDPPRPSDIVIEATETKNRIAIEFAVGESISELMLEYLDRRRALGVESNYLFCTRTGHKKAQSTLSQQLVEAIESRVGVRMTGHQFRHLTAAMILERRPEAIHQVQRLLGHKSLKTTQQFYAGLFPDAAGRVQDQLIANDRAALSRWMTKFAR